jgi:hypothetical protein
MATEGPPHVCDGVVAQWKDPSAPHVIMIGNHLPLAPKEGMHRIGSAVVRRVARCVLPCSTQAQIPPDQLMAAGRSAGSRALRLSLWLATSPRRVRDSGGVRCTHRGRREK